MFGIFQHLAEEPFGGLRIPFGAEHKVYRLTGRIENAVKVFPRAFHFYIGFTRRGRSRWSVSSEGEFFSPVPGRTPEPTGRSSYDRPRGRVHSSFLRDRDN